MSELTKEEVEKKARELLGSFPGWQRTRAPQYRNCPHEYVVRKWCHNPERWDEFAGLVKQYAERKVWRKIDRWKYLFLDGFIYWICEDVLNRTGEHALCNGGWPSEDEQKLVMQALDKGPEQPTI